MSTKKSRIIILTLTLPVLILGIVQSNSVFNNDMPQVKTVRFSGNDYEIGYQRAQLYVEELKEYEGISEKLFSSKHGEALNMAYQYHTTVLKEEFIKLFDEYQGMADGIGMQLEDIVIAHLGEEALWETAGLDVPDEFASEINNDPACSVFAMSYSDRGPIVGNTGDSSKPLKDGKYYFIEKLEYDDSYRIVRCKGAAINEMGLAIGSGNTHYAGKTGKPNGDGGSSGLSIVTVRYCPNTHSAVNFIKDYNVWDDGNHFAMADLNGVAAAVEKGPPGVFNVRWAKSTGNFDRACFVTNTPPSEEMRAFWWWDNPKYVGAYMICSDDRYNRLVDLFSDPNLEYTFETAEDVIFDHYPVGGICQHGDLHSTQQYTTRTRMMLPAEGRLLLAARLTPTTDEWRPCETGWAAQDTITIIKGKPLKKGIAAQDITAPPKQCVLAQNYPNPFNSRTVINYELLENSQVELTIYNMMGAKVITLKDEFESQGQHSTVWDGRNEFGQSISSGVYYYQLKVGNRIYTKRMTLLQ
jgi:hypothetical protein